MIEGVKILSFTHYLQGPSCVQTLADLGADVIKIESPKGAFERNWSGCDAYLNGISVFFMLGNRNQRSVSIDLKKEEGRQIVYDLVKEYDVVIENFRPGVMDKLGFSYEALKEINPRLIYCSCTGYGSSGPYYSKPGQDLLAQSIGGLAAMNGPADHPPMPMGSTVVDQHGAILAALGVLAAVYDREKTGKGHKVDASLLTSAIDLQMEPLGYYMNGGKLTPRAQTGLSTRFHESPYGTYRTSDGYITVSLTKYDKLLDVFDREAVERFKPEDQSHKRIEFDKMVAEQMLKHTTDEWIKIFEAKGTWYAKVNEYEDVLKDPQVVWNKVVMEMEHPVAGKVRVTSHPVRYDGETLPVRKLPPNLGEHSVEVLKSCGYDREKIEKLIGDGVILNGKPISE